MPCCRVDVFVTFLCICIGENFVFLLIHAFFSFLFCSFSVPLRNKTEWTEFLPDETFCEFLMALGFFVCKFFFLESPCSQNKEVTVFNTFFLLHLRQIVFYFICIFFFYHFFCEFFERSCPGPKKYCSVAYSQYFHII